MGSVVVILVFYKVLVLIVGVKVDLRVVVEGFFIF